jgi:hypothetical protein
MTARILAGILAAAVAVLGVHLVIAVAAVIIAGALTVLTLTVAIAAAESGWQVQPCRRRSAW